MDQQKFDAIGQAYLANCKPMSGHQFEQEVINIMRKPKISKVTDVITAVRDFCNDILLAHEITDNITPKDNGEDQK